MSLFLEQNYRKLLGFQITFDDTEYWLVCCQIWRRQGASERLPKYPLNCSRFVYTILYGVDLCILIPKLGFPEKKEEVRFINVIIS